MLINGAVEVRAKRQAEFSRLGRSSQRDDRADFIAVASAAIENGRLAAKPPGLGHVRQKRMAAFIHKN